jgi:hypothetical protein
MKGFYFDANGEFVTENETLIKVLKTQFKFEDVNLPSEDKMEALNVDFVEESTEEIEAVEEVETVEETLEVIEEIKPKRRGR